MFCDHWGGWWGSSSGEGILLFLKGHVPRWSPHSRGAKYHILYFKSGTRPCTWLQSAVWSNFVSPLIVNLYTAAKVIFLKHSFHQVTPLFKTSQRFCSAINTKSKLLRWQEKPSHAEGRGHVSSPHFSSTQCLASWSKSPHSLCAHCRVQALTPQTNPVHFRILSWPPFLDKETEGEITVWPNATPLVNGRAEAARLPKQDLNGSTSAAQ